MRLLISLPEGQNVRNLLENGFLDKFMQIHPESEVVIFTPAYKIEEFTKKWGVSNKISFREMTPYSLKNKEKYLGTFRKKLVKYGLKSLAKILRNRERQFKIKFYENLKSFLLEYTNETVLLCTHIHLPHERPLANLAHQNGIPVIGIVNSWDNVFKGIQTHVDKALVWNHINKLEMVMMEGYSEKDVEIFGVHQFEPYFKNENIVKRDEFCNLLGLDPKRPYIVYACLGSFVPFFEETFLLNELIKFNESFAQDERPQIVCRLHPWSKKNQFSSFFNNKDILFSEFESYTPTLNWTPTYAEMVFTANMLKHAQICVTPGSTMALEACYFDTPVIVPVYNDYQSDVWKNYYKNYCLAMHFGRLIKKDYLELANNRNEFFKQLKLYFQEKNYRSENRMKLVKDYIGEIDNPTERIVFALTSKLNKNDH